jgi:PIN domain nuclease of toxin-antitoxin system
LFVLDASALLALLFEEPGHDRVAVAADGASVSTVNLAEVLTRFVRAGHPVAAVLDNLETYAIEWVAFDDAHAAEVAALWPRTRRAGLSLADRAWAELGLPIDIRLIR